MRLAGRVLVVLALLVAHSGAEAHAYSHLTTDPSGLPTQSCSECLSFAPLHSAVGASPVPLLIEYQDAGDVVPAARLPAHYSSRPSPFQSRAPPELL